MGTPCKTAAGHAELAARDRQLSQRHRTLLFLVDGQRSLLEVLKLAALAGVPRAYLDELIALGLVVMVSPMPFACRSAQDAEPAPAEEFAGSSAPTSKPALLHRSIWPTASLQQQFSTQQDSIGFGDAAGETELAALAQDDPALDQARQVVLQALLHTVSVVGAVTMLRVRRSRSRAQLRALLPEVQARLSRPRHLADARLVIQRVEALLSR